MNKLPVSLVVTTLNNAATLEACLNSAAFCDEIVVLDSGSTDDTLEIAKRFAAQTKHQTFAGYGPQKMAAINLARHDWILLLDADEELSPALAEEIQQLLTRPPAVTAFRLRRAEWLLWRWPHRWTKLTDHLRLFDRRCIQMDGHPVHAAPKTGSATKTLHNRLLHHGERSLQVRLEKSNRYSSQSIQYLTGRKDRALHLRLLLSPPWAFFREYVLRRHFLNGWAGVLVSAQSAIYTFTKYAKILEYKKQP